ncbi:hypothetical protein GCM10023196_107810 [Actinoallomurus vinaceus]|uniref:Uncharacterized protein n=1 Tax=Actinoallomurus vinaceus TaxID=1080074 RepID=A0ABP8UVT3_9ACTN
MLKPADPTNPRSHSPANQGGTNRSTEPAGLNSQCSTSEQAHPQDIRLRQ